MSVKAFFNDSLAGGMEDQGANGKSAYEIAVEHGFNGTENEWLESLKIRLIPVDTEEEAISLSFADPNNIYYVAVSE